MKKVCGNCNWSKQDVPFGEYTCHNADSDCYGCECMYDDNCEDWEGENEEME